MEKQHKITHRVLESETRIIQVLCLFFNHKSHTNTLKLKKGARFVLCWCEKSWVSEQRDELEKNLHHTAHLLARVEKKRTVCCWCWCSSACQQRLIGVRCTPGEGEEIFFDQISPSLFRFAAAAFVFFRATKWVLSLSCELQKVHSSSRLHLVGQVAGQYSLCAYKQAREQTNSTLKAIIIRVVEPSWLLLLLLLWPHSHWTDQVSVISDVVLWLVGWRSNQVKRHSNIKCLLLSPLACSATSVCECLSVCLSISLYHTSGRVCKWWGCCCCCQVACKSKLDHWLAPALMMKQEELTWSTLSVCWAS